MMLKFIVMSLVLCSLLACQAKTAIPENENLKVQIHSESKVNPASELTPFTANTVKMVRTETVNGIRIDASRFTLPSHLKLDDSLTQSQSVLIADAGQGYSLPGELSLQWNWSRGGITVGRQALDTPYIQTDDGLLIPNLFESATVSIRFGENLDFSAYYIDNVSEWEFGTEDIAYKSFGNSLGARDTEAAAIIAAKFTSDLFNGHVWYYRIPDIEHIGYFELSHSGKFSEVIEYELSSQVEWARGAGESLLGEIGSTIIGLRTGISWSDYSIFAAYNRMISGSSTAIGIGGDPYYTSLENQSFSDIENSNGFAISGGLRFEPADSPLNFEIAMGRFIGSGQSEFDVREIDLSIGYNFSNGMDINMFFSSMSGRGLESDDHRFALSLSLPF